jgi:hypothetical protein
VHSKVGKNKGIREMKAELFDIFQRENQQFVYPKLRIFEIL